MKFVVRKRGRKSALLGAPAGGVVVAYVGGFAPLFRGEARLCGTSNGACYDLVASDARVACSWFPQGARPPSNGDPPLLSPAANPVKAEAGSPDPSQRMGPSRYQEGACALPSAPTPRPLCTEWRRFASAPTEARAVAKVRRGQRATLLSVKSAAIACCRVLGRAYLVSIPSMDLWTSWSATGAKRRDPQ